MPKYQTIKWEELWYDEFLVWICGDSNAYGGTLYFEKNDNREVVGLNNKDRERYRMILWKTKEFKK